MFNRLTKRQLILFIKGTALFIGLSLWSLHYFVMDGDATPMGRFGSAFAQTGTPTDNGGPTIFLPLVASNSDERRATMATASPEKLFALHLQRIAETVRTMREQLAANTDTTASQRTLQQLRVEIVALDPAIQEMHRAREQKLLGAGLAAEILQRHQADVKSYQQQRQALLDQIDQVIATQDKTALTTAVTALQSYLQPSEPQPTVIIPQDDQPDAKMVAVAAPVRDIREAGLDMTAAAAQAGLAVPNNPPVADDLAPSIDVQLTQDILDLAASLDHSPVKIYQYVKNHIAFEPYLGSRKGSQETLLLGAGNDYDQASLLIALLRASGIPARYVAGTVLLPAAQALNWLGVEHTTAAGNLLAMAGKQATVYTAPGGQSIGFKHLWVAAYVPYANYRGAPNDASGKLWVPLDPSMKQLEIRPGVDVPAAMNFNAAAFVDSYIATLHTLSPIELYLQQIEQYAAANYPALTYPDDIIRQRLIAPDTLALLPASLPYRVISQEADYWEIPANKRYRIRFEVLDDADATLLDYTADLPTIAGRRTTLSYEAATVADQAVIDLYGGLYATPPNLIYLKPVLRINGVAVAQGGRIRAGISHTTKRYYLKPAGDILGNNSTTHSISAGEYQGIAFDTFRARLGALNPGNNPTTPNPDGVLGAELYRAAMAYQDRLSQAWELTADTMQVVYATSVAQAVVTNQLKVFYSLSGIPVIWEPEGPTVDAQNKSVGGAYSISSGVSELIPFMILVGADGSILENRVFEDLYGQEAISTIKVLELASDAGIPICVITSSNLGDCATMGQSQLLINAINLALTLGYEVVVPKNSLTYHDWQGGGFIARHPVSKVGVWYIIEGGLNGGLTVDLLEFWLSPWRLIFLASNLAFCADEPPTAQVISPAPDSYWPVQKGWLPIGSINFDPWNLLDTHPVIEVRFQFCVEIGGNRSHSEPTVYFYPRRPSIPGDKVFDIPGVLADPFHYTLFDVQITTPDDVYAPQNGDSIELAASVIPRMPPDGNITWAKSGVGDGIYGNQIAETIRFSGTTTGDMIATATLTNPNGAVSDEQHLTVFGVQVLSGTTAFMGKGYDVPLAPPTPAQIFYYIDAPNHPEQGLFLARAVTMTIHQGAVLTHTTPFSLSLPGLHNTTWNGMNLDAHFVPAGVYQARVEVIAPNGKHALSDPYAITVVEVTGVAFFDINGNAIACPPPPAAPGPHCNQHPTHPGGVRLFPDSPAPGQPRNNKVKVRATLSAAVPITSALPIYFESFDVNDPTGLIDDNHPDSIENIPGTGRINDMNSDGDNMVETDFTVTMQPGDNFKVFASTNLTLIDNLDDASVEATTDITGTTTDLVLQPLASDRLTIWRRVQLEVDSMGLVAGNEIVGDITNVMTTVVTSTLTTNQNFLEPNFLVTATHRFEGGILTDSVGSTFTVITNTYGNNLTIVVQNLAGGVTPILGPFTLVDDDDFNNNDGANLDGDRNEDVDPPNLSLVQSSEVLADNVLAEAYIIPMYTLGGNHDVAFVTNTLPGNAFTQTFEFANQATEENHDFWTGYILAAYQASTLTDNDPNIDEAYLGLTDGDEVGIAVFLATQAEILIPSCAAEIVVAHELGHLFGVDHHGGGDLMEERCNNIAIPAHFDPDSLTIIRDQVAP